MTSHTSHKTVTTFMDICGEEDDDAAILAGTDSAMEGGFGRPLNSAN